MVKIEATYQGDLRCIAVHGPSGTQIITDAPVDNHGKGESFSPTDLLATSMLTCIMTIIGIRANSREINVEGMVGSINKIMATNPRRIGRLEIEIKLPDGIEIDDKAWLITEGCNCPVCASVSDSMELDITFSD